MKFLLILTFIRPTFGFNFVTDLRETDREQRYCCPMSTDNVTLVIDEYTCVGVYHERRRLNIDCVTNDFEIVELDAFLNESKVEIEGFCYVTELDEEVQLIAICLTKLPIQWIIDFPDYLKCVSIFCLLLTLYGYAKVETLRRPEDMPFIIFTGCLMLSIIADLMLFVCEKVSITEKTHILLYLQYYTNIGSLVWFNVILVYRIRENL